MPEFEMVSGVDLPEPSAEVPEAENDNYSELGPARYPEEVPASETEEVETGKLTFNPETPGDYGAPPQQNESR